MLPRGPRTPRLWQTYRFITSPQTYTRTARADYGTAFGFKGLNGEGLALMDPALAREVFNADADAFEVPPLVARLFGTRSVIATSGAVHRRQRRLLNPRFHGARVKNFLETIAAVVRNHMGVLHRAAQTGETLLMTDFAQSLTLDVILETIFGADDAAARLRGREVLLGLVHSVGPSLLISHLHHSLFPPWRKFTESRAALDAWIDSVVANRRRRGELGDDVLGSLLEAHYEDGAPMELSEIRDQVMTLLMAGHETTAIAVAWGVHWLLREPATLAKLQAEMDALGPAPSAQAIARAPYLGAVAAESLRVEPIVTDIIRVCRKPLAVGPWTVPAGGQIVILIGAILADESLFPEPSRFRPERFLERAYHAGEFLPFGGGQRRCLGAAFAEAELTIALGMIAQEWNLELVDRTPDKAVRRNITMGPSPGVRVRVRGRRVPVQPARPRSDASSGAPIAVAH